MNKLGEWWRELKLKRSADNYLDIVERSRQEGVVGLEAQRELQIMGNKTKDWSLAQAEKFAEMVNIRKLERDARATSYVSGAGQF